MSSLTLRIHVGIIPEDYHSQNQLDVGSNIDKQPAGLTFYEQNWESNQKGTVIINDANYGFTIKYVLSSTGTEDVDYPEKGIDYFSINSSLVSDEFVSHDEARVLFMQTLHELLTIGWNPYIEYFSPRLAGQQSIRYAIEDGTYEPDPSYVPTLDEWMRLGADHSWMFHVEDVFMIVSFRRNPQFMESEGKGVYLINYKLFSREAHAQEHFSGETRDKWQAHWVDEIKISKSHRYQKEVELIKQGYRINTEYVEPKIHPDDPVEPDNARDLTEFIQRNNPKQ